MFRDCVTEPGVRLQRFLELLAFGLHLEPDQCPISLNLNLGMAVDAHRLLDTG